MKRFFSLLLVVGMATAVMAVPARRGGIVRTAEDGTEKIVYLHGNAFGHWMTDEEGNWLDEKTLAPMTADQKVVRAQANEARTRARRVQQAKKVGGELNLAPRGLLILVNFKDLAFVTPIDTMKNMINGEHFTRNYTSEYTYKGKKYTDHITSSGSARQYFHDVSWGQYNPVFDVVGPVTINQNMSYYGKNDSGGNDENVDAMIREACKAVENQVDFTLYDNDNDGNVDFVYFIYAGYGEADGGATSTIWPHNWDYAYYGSSQLKVDGKNIRNYACSNELNYYGGQYAGIGTFCHEFSHVLGLPDLYETNQNLQGLHTLFDWDILDYGPYNNDGNTPPAYSAYERFYMGWLTPRVLKDPELITMPELNTADEGRRAYLICQGDSHNLVGTDPYPSTFYMIENRQKRNWDEYLPGEGMLITKIQYKYNNWTNNTVNNTASNMGVDIMEATPNSSDYAKPTDAFPAGATSWTSFSGHEITDIQLESGVISFSYRGGTQDIENTKEGETTAKMLRDGQVVIIRNGVEYDLTGQVIGDW